MYLVGLEELPHRLFEIGLLEPVFFGLVFFDEGGGRVVVRVLLFADVAVLAREASKEIEERPLGYGGAFRRIKVGDPAVRQEEAALVSKDDGFAARAVLVFEKLKLTQVVIALLPAFGPAPLRYCRKRNAPCQAVEPEMPEPELMPCRLGWLRTVTEPSATIASACMCMAKP